MLTLEQEFFLTQIKKDVDRMTSTELRAIVIELAIQIIEKDNAYKQLFKDGFRISD